MAAATAHSIGSLARLLEAAHPRLVHDEIAALAKLYFTMINGSLLIWLASPDQVLSGDEVRRALTIASTRRAQ